MGRWLRWLCFQRTWIRFPERTRQLLPSAASDPGGSTPSLDLPGYQVHTWCTDFHAGRTLLHIKQIKKKLSVLSQPPMMLIKHDWILKLSLHPEHGEGAVDGLMVWFLYKKDGNCISPLSSVPTPNRPTRKPKSGDTGRFCVFEPLPTLCKPVPGVSLFTEKKEKMWTIPTGEAAHQRGTGPLRSQVSWPRHCRHLTWGGRSSSCRSRGVDISSKITRHLKAEPTSED